MPPETEEKASDLYVASRGQLQHYDLSMGLRLIWLNNSQAFMFGIYSATVIVKAPLPIFLPKEQTLAMLLPIVGFLVSLFTLFDVIASLAQMNQLNMNYRHHGHPDGSEGNLPLLSGTLLEGMFQRVAPVSTAILFSIVWGFLFLYDHKLIRL